MSVAIVNNLPQEHRLDSFSQQSKAKTELGVEGTAKAVKGERVEESKETKPKTNFLQELLSHNKSSSSKVSPEDLQDRASRIFQKGKLVREHPLPDTVKDYIKEVKELLVDVKDHAYKSNFEDGMFQKMDLVDSKLVEISDHILENQTDQLELVASLGQLEGLLVDIFV